MKNHTDITILLDRSGSMGDIKDSIVEGLNSFVAKQKAVPGEATISLIQFDDISPFEPVWLPRPLKNAPELQLSDFKPRGNTPLNDAIGRTIVHLGERLEKMPESERPDKVIVLIVSDGAENASLEYNYAKIQQMVKHQTDTYSWQFVYIGTKHDAQASAGSVGISQKSAAQFNPTRGGTKAVYCCTSDAVARYRSGTGGQSVQFTSEEISHIKQTV